MDEEEAQRKKAEPEQARQAEFERQRRYATEGTQGETRKRYYDAGDQYMHEHELIHPPEKHVGKMNRFLHGLMGAGLGLMANAQPDQRGWYDLPKMLGGALTGGAWSGIRPAAADTLYNRVFIEPEAAHQREKQLIKEKLIYDKLERGMKLTDMESQIAARGTNARYQEMLINKGNLDIQNDPTDRAIDRTLKTAQAGNLAAGASHSQASADQIHAQMEFVKKNGQSIAPGSPWIRLPDGSTVYYPEKDAQGNAMSPSQVASYFNVLRYSPEMGATAQTEAALQDQGVINQSMKDIHGGGPNGAAQVEQWMSLVQAYEDPNNPKVPDKTGKTKTFAAINPGEMHSAGEYIVAKDQLDKLKAKVKKYLYDQFLQMEKKNQIDQQASFWALQQQQHPAGGTPSPITVPPGGAPAGGGPATMPLNALPGYIPKP